MRMREEGENQYHLIKYNKSFIVNMHKYKLNIPVVSSNQAKKFISSTSKFVFLFLRQNKQ